jgi:hypothetical protein
MKSQYISIDRTAAKGAVIAGACALTITAVVIASALVVTSREATAKPEFATQTGKPCLQCHANPAGGGKLKAYGEKFKANGNKIK